MPFYRLKLDNFLLFMIFFSSDRKSNSKFIHPLGNVLSCFRGLAKLEAIQLTQYPLVEIS